MPKPTAAQFSLGLWSLGLLVSLLAYSVWSSVNLGVGKELSAYDFFPLLGLLAFSLMWTHYIGGTLRKVWELPKAKTQRYFTYTSWAVLVLILLHPGIFWTALYLDGFGLPPISYLTVYTDTIMRIALLLGTLSLIAFLAFELHRKYSQALWWKYIDLANIIAMFAIFYHALTLGGELDVTWYRVLWYVYGITLALAISYSYKYREGGNSYEK